MCMRAAVLNEDKTKDEPKVIALNLLLSLDFGEQVRRFLPS